MVTDISVIIISVLTLAVQIFLCFKGKYIWIKLIPVFLCVLATTVFFTLTVCTDGWDVIGYLLLTFLSAFLLAVCTLGWAIWVIVTIIRKRKTRKPVQ